MPVRAAFPLPARGRTGSTYASPGPRGVNASIILPVRIIGREAFGYPVITAGGILLGDPPWRQGLTYMPAPDGQGDIIWRGGQFGIPAGTGSAQVNEIAITVTQRVSAVPAFSSVTAQVFDGNTPIGTPHDLTISDTYVTETFTVTTGYPAADLPDLTVQLVFHEQTMGLAYVNHVYAAAGISYANAIGPFSAAGITSIPAPSVTVQYGPAQLVSQGGAAFSLTPSFGRNTTAGNLLIAWIFNNSFSAFDVTTSGPGWELAAYTGVEGGWESLWYKPDCGADETPPVFTGGGSTLLSGLMEFSGARYLDQTGGDYQAQPLVVTADHVDTKSGDLIMSFGIWGSSAPGPVVMTMTGTDSSGAVLPLTVANNSDSAGNLFWMTGWGQASAPAGPGLDTITSSFGHYIGGGGGIVASFEALPLPPPPPYVAPVLVNRTVVVPMRAGRF